jgi:hypothetical protein
MEPFLLRLDDRFEFDIADFDSRMGVILLGFDESAVDEVEPDVVEPNVVEPDDFRNILVKNRFGLGFGEAVSIA